MTPIAAVTGASRGIGRATALALAREGYHVFALARSEPDLLALAQEATGQGLQITPVVLDIADEAARHRAARQVLDVTDGYGVDVLVNNAGYAQMGPLEELSAQGLRRQLEVNVVGLLAFTQPFLDPMRRRGRGCVVNVGSIAGRIASPFLGAYNASKFALEGMNDALRFELAPFGIRVILIEPGPIRSSFGEAAETFREDRLDSPYAPFQRSFRTARGGANLFERSSETVARVIVRAVRSSHPRSRYVITLPARLGSLASRLVPSAVIDWFMLRAMRLPSRKRSSGG
jgi:NAD(P)-dependent dehydrogenase (short-subunit alcohol dehydrogenase family)